MTNDATDNARDSESHTTYLRNMALLWRHDPQLAMLVDAVPDSARPPVEKTRSGEWTVAITSQAGRRTYLHSRYDPKKEAGQIVDNAVTDDQYCFVVGGFGLGHHIVALEEAITSDAIVVVAEPDIALLAAALASVDLTKVLGDGRLIVLHSTDKVRLTTSSARTQPCSCWAPVSFNIPRRCNCTRRSTNKSAG